MTPTESGNKAGSAIHIRTAASACISMDETQLYTVLLKFVAPAEKIVLVFTSWESMYVSSQCSVCLMIGTYIGTLYMWVLVCVYQLPCKCLIFICNLFLLLSAYHSRGLLYVCM